MQDDPSSFDPGRSLTVLVVEDEVLIAMDLEMMLEGNGYAVLGPATSIANALNLLDDARPEVALLDLNVRGQLVIPVAERLRSLGIPFVLASAYSSFDSVGGEAVADAENVGKPTHESRLLKALARAVSPA